MMSLMRNMTRVILNIFLILSIVIIAANAQNQFITSTSKEFSAPSATNSIDNESSKIKTLEILGIDPTAFPKIKVNLFIDKFCAMAGNLKKEDFKVKEDDIEAAIDNFYFTGNASGQNLDLAIVFDETTSMDAEINALKSKVKDLTQKINSSKLDARYSLVTFNGADVATKINWTNDADTFRNTIGKLSTSGGNSDLPENSLDGIERALSFGFRPDAQKVIIMVTDEPSQQKGDGKSNSAYTMEDVKSDLLNSGAMLIAISPDFRNRNVDPNVPRSDLPKYADMRDLASQSSSMWIDINSADFTTIMEQFKGIITGTYVIEYTTPDQTSFGSRNATVSADALGCLVDNDSSSYIVPENSARLNNPPTIDSMTSDKKSPQDARTAITWTANAIDPDGDLVLYRFFLDGWPMTQWAEDKTWIWVAGQAGSYRVEVQVRDAKHADPDGLDDRRVESFTINEPKPGAPENQPPIVDDLLATQGKAKEIAWTTNATDSDEDQILYRYFLNNKSMTDWNDNDKWTLNATEADVGENHVEVQIRDGKHAGPEGYDDSKSVQFKLSSMKLMVQTREKTFGGPNNDMGLFVQKTNDGGYIVAGQYDDADAWLIKTNAQGNEEWNKTFDGWLGDSVQQTSDGGYLIMASSGGDSRVIKTDPSGNKQREITLGGNVEGASLGQQTSEGGYIIMGTTSSYGEGMTDILLIKTDPDGNVLWDKTFGGSRLDYGYSIKQTSDGGYIIGGLTFVSARDEDQRGWLIKTDANGNKVWTKTLSQGQGPIASVQQTTDGGYIIAGSTFSIVSGRLSSKALLMKTDSLGNEEWAKTFNGNFNSVQLTGDGGYIVAGSSSHNSYLMKTDSQGFLEWERTLTHGGSGWDDAVSVQQTSDGGYILTGYVGEKDIQSFPDGSTVRGGADVLLIKTDANGNV